MDEIQRPISEAGPCGEEVTYDDDFQKIKAEIEEGGTLGGRIDYQKAADSDAAGFFGEDEAAAGINYPFIVEASREILRSKSKDLRVASYLAVGLFHTKGLAGLAEGLAALNTLVETFWDDLYPPKRRARARKSAFGLAVGRLTKAREGYKPALEDRASIEQALAVVEKLQPFLMEAMQEHAPALSGFKNLIKKLEKRIPKAPPPAPAQEAAEVSEPEEKQPVPEEKLAPKATQPAPAKAPETAPSSAPAPPTALNSVSAARRRIFEAATFLHKQEAWANPVAYRLNRVVRWGGLQTPSHEDGKTQLPAPDGLEHRRRHFTDLLDKGRYDALVQAAEACFQEETYHYWLDLQRFIVAGLDGLGARFQPAREAVLQEMALLLRRLPALPSLSFLGSVPFAEARTERWIALDVTSILGAGQEAASAQGSAEGSGHVEAKYEEARRQLVTGGLAGALGVMQQGTEQDRSGQDHFRRRLYVAALCIKGGRPVVACPVLERLDEEIARHALDIWSPALALEVWSNLYRCYEAMAASPAVPGTESIRERASAVFDKICRIDAQYALGMMGP